MHLTNSNTNQHSIIILASPNTYRSQSYAKAAARIGINIIWVIDIPEKLAAEWSISLSVDFSNANTAIKKILPIAKKHNVISVLSIDDSAALIAAKICSILGLIHNSPSASLAARNKYIMRKMLKNSDMLNPNFKVFKNSEIPNKIAEKISFPCVLKPLLLNGSRGVIRANDPEEFTNAWNRITKILNRSIGTQILVEDYIPGEEVAVEALLYDNSLKILAIFDKPDPLDGPFFEETIYVTPSKLSLKHQKNIEYTLTKSTKALGLTTGPIHAEFRINDRGVWPIEVAARTIGGLCSNILDFGSGISLEELVLSHVTGVSIESLQLDDRSRGVMMIPIPKQGLLRKIIGIENAEAVEGIESIEITAKLNYPLEPLPEGDGYLGFIFAYGESSIKVEKALRKAHALLKFEIEPNIVLKQIQ